jgi:hypothetical protein
MAPIMTVQTVDVSDFVDASVNVMEPIAATGTIATGIAQQQPPYTSPPPSTGGGFSIGFSIGFK